MTTHPFRGVSQYIAGGLMVLLLCAATLLGLGAYEIHDAARMVDAALLDGQMRLAADGGVSPKVEQYIRQRIKADGGDPARLRISGFRRRPAGTPAGRRDGPCRGGAGDGGQSSARLELADRSRAERTFHQILRTNLGGAPYSARVAVLPGGGRDPLSGQRFDRPVVSARLTMEHRLAYPFHWLPAVRLELVQTAFGADRKAGAAPRTPSH